MNKPDQLTRPQIFTALACTGLGSFVAALIAWAILDRTNLPAFNTSMVTRGLATAVSVGLLVLVAVLLWQWRTADHHPRWRGALTYLVSYLSPAGLTIATLGIPLSATRLWLDGLQVDQLFRTQFLTRTATNFGYQDMNYLDMPTYYPLGWFWGGGRLANLLDMPGWEVYQPWALVSLATAAALLVPVWQALTGSLPLATTLALANTAVTLSMAADEPYAAIVGMGIAPAVVMAARAVRGSWLAVAGVAVYLGVSATMYTLFVGVTALIAIVLTIHYFWTAERSIGPFLRLVVMGLGSMAIAAISWGPYLYLVATADYKPSSVAQHFLPSEGTQVPLPFFEFSALGFFSLLGLLYLVLRSTRRPLLIATVVLYGWVLASMLMTLLGSTLLGFRIELPIALILSTAGFFALADTDRAKVVHFFESRKINLSARQLSGAFTVLLVAASIGYAQQISVANEDEIDHAYTDTDGYGERADQYAPGSAKYFPEIVATLGSAGHSPQQTVLLTDENSLLSYYPYYGFNGFTSHYANPMGQYTERNDTIKHWAEASFDELADPQDFAAALEDTEWKGPDAFVFRGDEDDEEFKTHIAVDLFPNNPNVAYESVFFNSEVFADDALWDIEQVGPYVVISRTK
ncbi:galactan 5-O-arabinofuranosyltransferase [Corynebacterium propinquum]|uniref:galactan 5-O-arabinofuranosyltransferase n=1 Tax=Corynebacterium propinquum TaxID=43769 RepID=UPI000DB1FB34|nr:galactan 5-O-arabinofuranosyltransferase [Corynebacterium propinquum]MDK4258733.1 galactan 5-O-arabinofuranosyltransferase [Corynebacterium propinquum]MDK4282252.1 galactan 5-O-arabinofuranosyltransferase [Corynebacterium propinquum]MDK4299421.1 galactan 5-O-arabinofuranosyltransferase [Corynebacterium propinquum]MDK4303512.1 galactan 5-O-arabinofuranosyltransferase [Corynebacterium propinquum]MDK4319567.1 galactan 5-O-arabinofuranosyltransferase [Corynebacterium propinquum]